MYSCVTFVTVLLACHYKFIKAVAKDLVDLFVYAV